MKQHLLLTLLIPMLFLGLFSCKNQHEKVRITEKFNSDWKFSLTADSLALSINYNDSNWRTLNLPHDWSIEGEFSEKNPANVGGGALPGGLGWYRKYFKLNKIDSAKRIYITFDGVYMNSEVYVNGKFIGKRPNGYISFQYDITDAVVFGETQNVIAVKVDNSKQPNSRWYSGSGIYRNVWLVKTNAIHVENWGTYITTPGISDKKAIVEIETKVKNTKTENSEVTVITSILNKENKKVTYAKNLVSTKGNEITLYKLKLEIEQPQLWSIENPYLYTVLTEIEENGEIIDTYETSLGVRSFEFDLNKGFILNGKQVKILGVCNHHDLGALGAAVNYRAIERQLEIMKEMGANAIRTSHNAPAPELLDLCDKMGFIVMDEAFDMWAKKKMEYDYAQFYEQWHERDLTDQILRDRNHPSVFIWSIGNEIYEQWDSTGTPMAIELAKIVKNLDAYRPITSACNDPKPHNNIIKSEVLDLIGYNYSHKEFDKFQTTFPGKKFIATETTSALQTRGYYEMPADTIRIWPERWDKPFTGGNPEQFCSAYDNCRTPWGSSHEDSWRMIKKHDYLSGMFIWTGFDYLGEPTPYGWPSRSSYFGIVDLAGFPKDVYYMYQSEWTTKPVLHVFPHWNWQPGQTVDIWAYTNFDEVELFVNGKSQGKKSKQTDDLHLAWKVVFEAGTLKVVGKSNNGKTMETIINTAGNAAKIQLIADRKIINVGGEDLSFITVNILDEDGNLVPNANNLVKFELPENIELAGVDNGLQTSMESFKIPQRKAFNGKCLLIVKSKFAKGKFKINAVSEGLKDAEITIEVK